jgi:hypothetical protein
MQRSWITCAGRNFTAEVAGLWTCSLARNDADERGGLECLQGPRADGPVPRRVEPRSLGAGADMVQWKEPATGYCSRKRR